jgi:hypothetical protein
MAFKLDDYEPVAARLWRWLDRVTKDGKYPRVMTHLHHYDDKRCVFRAELYEYNPATGSELLVATGWAEETRGEGMVNKTSHLENCESSSVGRALANAGLSGSDHTKRPSREEMTKVARNTYGEPAEDPFAASPAPQYDEPRNPGKASDKQVGMIRALARSQGLQPGAPVIEAISTILGRKIGLLTDLTKADASKVIDAWKGS